jgi:hypothetical protein
MNNTIVSYGGGTNSAAMLIGLWERNEPPDAITFADTKGEKPHTYHHIILMNEWCKKVGFPEIISLKADMPQQIIDGSLEQECLRLGKLPAKAYGFSSCSDKWKMDPQRKFNAFFAMANFINLSDITRLIGFDADEHHRVERGKSLADKKPVKERYPLYEWGWGREECMAAIKRAGLPQPGKSACFFCPSSKKTEILELKRRYPELYQRAVIMERRALAGEGQAPRTTSAGLGRTFSWEDFIRQMEINSSVCSLSNAGVPEMDCGCYDGE